MGNTDFLMLMNFLTSHRFCSESGQEWMSERWGVLYMVACLASDWLAQPLEKNWCIANANAVCDLCIISTLITDLPMVHSLIKCRKRDWCDECEADRISQDLSSSLLDDWTLLHMLILKAWAGILYQISTTSLISQKANMLFRMMLSTFLPGLMSERPR